MEGGHWIASKFYKLEDRPLGLTSDDNGNIYYGGRQQKIWKLNLNDKTVEPIITCVGFSPSVPILWSNNHIYFAHPTQQLLCRYSFETNEVTEIRLSTHGGHISRICGLAVDKEGDLYICGPDSILKLNRDTNYVKTIAGSSVSSGFRDGGAPFARFNRPSGIAVGSDGTIYVSDSMNFCVRKITWNQVSTVAGKHTMKTHIDGKLRQSAFMQPDNIHLWDDSTLVVRDHDLFLVRLVDMKRDSVTSLELDGYPITCSTLHKGDLVLGTPDGVVVMEQVWKWIRLLWIGHIKEDATECHWAKVPKDVIKEIIVHTKGVLKKQTTVTFMESFQVRITERTVETIHKASWWSPLTSFLNFFWQSES